MQLFRFEYQYITEHLITLMTLLSEWDIDTTI